MSGQVASMLCQFCHSNEAGLVLKQIVDGEVRDVHVCTDCAQQEGLGAPSSLGELLLGREPSPTSEPTICSGCGLDLETFRRVGRVGCEQCYTTFSERLSRMIRNMQPGSVHIGQNPALDQRHETLAELREELSEAIATQAFEKAAELRDRIHALEAELPRGGGVGMQLAPLLKPANALIARAPGGVVLSSRIRLARNLAGQVFPSRASETARAALVAAWAPRLLALPAFKGGFLVDHNDRLTLQALAESWFSSSRLPDLPQSAAVLGPDGVGVMLNEEDHLRLQVVVPGYEFTQCWDRIQGLDESISQLAPYAYSSELGHLTCCPSNLGTGLRASVMVALPALRILGESEAAIRGLEAMGYAVRGVHGEGSDPSGALFQISNQGTLGLAEDTIIQELSIVVHELVHQECHARGRLLEQRPVLLVDYCARSLALIRYAKLSPSAEALDLLGGLRLGVECGIVRGVSLKKICALMVACQPAHMKIEYGAALDGLARDASRADLLRRSLRSAVLEKEFR